MQAGQGLPLHHYLLLQFKNMKTLLIGLLFATMLDGSIYDFKVPGLNGWGN